MNGAEDSNDRQRYTIRLMGLKPGASREKLVAALLDGGGGGGSDAESRMRLRSIDVQLLRILEEMAAGRQETLTDLKTDIGQLTNAIRQLGRGTGRA